MMASGGAQECKVQRGNIEIVPGYNPGTVALGFGSIHIKFSWYELISKTQAGIYTYVVHCDPAWDIVIRAL